MNSPKREVHLFNTFTRELEVFKPLNPPVVTIYSCGPTVYNFAHIGNLKAFLFADILKRTLTELKFDVKHVMNITDVGHLTSDADEGDDKVELQSKKENRSVWELVEFYTNQFNNDITSLNIAKPWRQPKATDHITEQISLIEKLEHAGFTYEADDGIYFDTKKFSDYGIMANLDKQKLKGGARIAMSEGKKSITDFALWKFSPKDTTRQMEWSSPWGNGFPGWHIECSAMSMKYLGETIDIHTGGEDHINIHHTNEIAQSEATTGKKFVSYWLHSSFLLVDGKKMSKSLGNTYTISDIIKKGYDPLAFRYLILTAHYRTTLNFTWDSLKASDIALKNIRKKIGSLPDNGSIIKKEYDTFLQFLSNDLDTPKALSHLHKILKSDNKPEDIKATILVFDYVFKLNLDHSDKCTEKPTEELLTLLKERVRLRSEKNWSEADIIRQKIEKLGYTIEDIKGASKLHKK